MNGKFVLRFTIMFALVSFSLAADDIDLRRTPYAAIGNADQTGYYDTNGGLHPAFGVVVGGYLDPWPAPPVSGSKAVSATDLGILSFDPLGNPLTYTTPDLENALGLLTADLNGLLADPTTGVANGSAIYWTDVDADAGDTVNFTWDFVANDNFPFNDFAFFSVSGPAKQVVLLSDILTVGDFGSSGATALTYQFLATGSYTVGLGSVNVGPYSYATDGINMDRFNFDPLDAGWLENQGPLGVDSALLTDVVPEPASWSLMAAALLLLAGRARRRKAN